MSSGVGEQHPWYRDTVIVHNRRIANVVPTPPGSYSFLETAKLGD